jgi:hypothetical protein
MTKNIIEENNTKDGAETKPEESISESKDFPPNSAKLEPPSSLLNVTFYIKMMKSPKSPEEF